ncbi:ABC transporter permease [Paenibacillus sp. IITD108]|uniref:ABC transporter permease n=1 Tax=Paenibacillus sp. IITD108 TaxID=3116649 RepID=UPI002F403E1D
MNRSIWQNWQLYALLILPVMFVAIFAYGPMYGLIIAFKKFSPVLGMWDSPWVGLKNFERFINYYGFWNIMKNTVVLSVYAIVAGFPLPILLALGLNYVKNDLFKRSVQMITYIPYFISVVVVVGMIHQFINPRTGILGQLLHFIMGESVNILLEPGSFMHIMVWSGIWQGVGFGSIIYMSVLAGISPELHEAAMIDGASKARRMWHIDLPGIMPTAIIFLILSVGGILNSGFEKILLLQNDINISASEVIDTYSYKVGLTGVIPDPSYATAIGLFKSIIGFALLYAVNRLARRFESSIW